MSVAWQFYLITLLVFFGVNLIAGWSLNLQTGVTGILNFSFVIFQSIGAYVAAVTSLGRASASGFQQYVFGATLPWPIPWLLAGASGALLALVIGSFALRPIGRDFQAMVLLIVSVMALIVVSSENWLFNGSQGLANIPKPLSGVLGSALIHYGWFYVGLTAVTCAISYFIIHRITSSPYGRRLRALRDNPISASALGINVRRDTLAVFMIGGAIAAVSGAVLVGFIGVWAPSAWGVFETFLYLAALTVGGMGNNAGTALGVAVVITGILQGVQYLPSIGGGALIGATQLMAVALLLVAFLWLRPQGIIPERRKALRQLITTSAPTTPADGPPPAPRTPRGASESHPASERAADVIRVDHLSRSFGGVRAVDDVSFTARRREITGLIGPNGAGKSTVINLIAGVVRPSSGAVFHEGKVISGLSPHRIADRGIIRTFQLSSEFARLTVLENMLAARRFQRGRNLTGAMLGKRYWKQEQQQNLARAWDLLGRFELQHMADEWAGELSGGQKRLLELARALMASPHVLLLDEPLGGISPLLRTEVESHLISLREDGLTMIMVEHELGAVERCTDSVIVMALGRVLAQGSMANVRSNQDVVDAYLVG